MRSIVFLRFFLVHIFFEENDFEPLDELERNIQRKPRYIPTKTKFVKYSNETYVDKITEAEQIENFLVNNQLLRPKDAATLVTDLCMWVDLKSI